jgi:hypothetical protein
MGSGEKARIRSSRKDFGAEPCFEGKFGQKKWRAAYP